MFCLSIRTYCRLTTRQFSTQKFRPSVGAIIFNRDRKILCGKRMDIGYWQFPQGGVDTGEDHISAAFREVAEELGLSAANLKITEDQSLETFTYHRKIVKDGTQYDGQMQRYILFRWDGEAASCNLRVNGQPEFSTVEWLSWDELIPKSVPSRTDIYKKLRVWAEEMIDKYNTLDDLVSLSYSGTQKTSARKEDPSDSWLSTHQRLPSPSQFFTSSSLIRTPTKEVAPPVNTFVNKYGNNFFSFIVQDGVPAMSAGVLGMGMSNWKYLVENCK